MDKISPRAHMHHLKPRPTFEIALRFAWLAAVVLTYVFVTPLSAQEFATDLASSQVFDSQEQISLGYENLPSNTGIPSTLQVTRAWEVSADLLYWTVSEGSADNWAQEITPLGPGTTLGTAKLVDAPFDWSAGLRVGVAKQVDENANIGFCYTNFSTQATNRASGEVYSAFLGNFFAGNPDGVDFGPHYQSAHMEWDFDFHTFDLELGHDLFISNSLMLRPFVGLKAAIINQQAHSTWQGPIDTPAQTYLFDSAFENLQHDFWGIGPSLGVLATMPCYTDGRSAMKIFASPSVALMYGHWQFEQHYQNDGPTSIAIPIPTSISIDMSPIDGAATMARGALGLEWTQDYFKTTTTLRLGYEAQVWLNQMQNYSFNMGRLNNLSSLHGGVLELSVGY